MVSWYAALTGLLLGLLVLKIVGTRGKGELAQQWTFRGFMRWLSSVLVGLSAYALFMLIIDGGTSWAVVITTGAIFLIAYFLVGVVYRLGKKSANK